MPERVREQDACGQRGCGARGPFYLGNPGNRTCGRHNNFCRGMSGNAQGAIGVILIAGVPVRYLEGGAEEKEQQQAQDAGEASGAGHKAAGWALHGYLQL